MEIRQMAAAYLFKDGKVLMIKKTNSRLNSSEFWSGLGGHVNPDEINEPKAACLREYKRSLEFSKINQFMLEHYLTHQEEQEPFIGVISINEKQEPTIQWSELKDPMIF